MIIVKGFGKWGQMTAEFQANSFMDSSNIDLLTVLLVKGFVNYAI